LFDELLTERVRPCTNLYYISGKKYTELHGGGGGDKKKKEAKAPQPKKEPAPKKEKVTHLLAVKINHSFVRKLNMFPCEKKTAGFKTADKVFCEFGSYPSIF